MTEEFVSGYVVGFVLAMTFMMIGLPWMVEVSSSTWAVLVRFSPVVP